MDVKLERRSEKDTVVSSKTGFFGGSDEGFVYCCS